MNGATIRALLAVELRRALSRRLVRVLTLLLAAAVVVAGVVTFFKTADRVELDADAYSITCEGRGSTEFGEDHGPGQLPEGCVRTPVERDRRFHLRSLEGILAGTAGGFTPFALVVGASLMGAEWRSGSMGTTLTWEPRRTRLFAVKLLAALAVTAALYVLVQALLSLVLLPSALLHGTTSGVDVGLLAGRVLRGGAVGLVMATIGFGIGSLGRNTGAAVGGMFVYVQFLENGLLAGLLPWVREWLFTPNMIVFLTGDRVFGELGDRSRLMAAIVILAYAAIVAGTAAAMFRRRDVTA